MSKENIDFSKRFNPPQELLDLIKRSSERTIEGALAAMEFAKAIELPLRQGILYGENGVRRIYEPVKYGPSQTVEMPLDPLSPGSEDEFVAYVSPGVGSPGERRLEGDYVTIPTYPITDSMSWELRITREATWPVIARYLQILEAGFVRKLNNDGWYLLLTAAVERNLQVYDADATAGQFTKRLLSLGKVTMTRNGGGNASSIKQSALTDFFMSPEGSEDMRNWGVDQLDEVSRREIYVADDSSGALSRVFGVNINVLREFGVGQEYQNFYLNQLGGTLESADVELAIGLDLKNKDSFVMPYKREVEIFHDDSLRRQGRDGYWGEGEFGFGCLDNRRVLSFSY
jgi:hypothetical protein